MNSSILLGITVLNTSLLLKQNQAGIGSTDVSRYFFARLLRYETNIAQPARTNQGNQRFPFGSFPHQQEKHLGH